jgi:hypothetical protein
MYWLAYRSDTINNVNAIARTTLSIDISEHDGETAKCVISGGGAHGLFDGQLIGIAGVIFNGIYAVEKETDDIFYIRDTSGTLADEASVAAYYATVTTVARFNADGTIQLESANHNLRTGDKAIIDGASIGWDASYTVFVDPAWTNTFRIPITSAVSNYTYVAGAYATSTLPLIYVRTESGPLKLQQGEVKYVGAGSTDNIMNYIGMSSASASVPMYSFVQHPDVARHMIYGFENYGADGINDNLTQRIARLTSMMADKAQDKVIRLASHYDSVSNATNLFNQDITFASVIAPVLNIALPGSISSGSISLTGTLSLPQNYAAYFIIDRNASFSLANLAALTVGPISTVPVHENIFIFAYRLNTASVYLWNNNELGVGTYASPAHLNDLVNQNKTIQFLPDYDFATKTTNGINQDITFTSSGVATLGMAIPSSPGNGLLTLTGTLSLAANQAAYFTIDRNAAFSLPNLAALTVGPISGVPLLENTYVFAYRLTGTSVWLWDGIELIDGNNLTQGVVSAIINENAYDETMMVVVGVPATLWEIQGPVVPTTSITLPPDSRDGSSLQSYIVGKGVLEVYLNGQYLNEGVDWSEVGVLGALSSQIVTNIQFEITDEIEFRIDTAGGYVGVGGGGGGDITDGQSDPLGSGSSVYRQKLGTIIEMRTIKAGAGINVIQNAHDIEIVATSGGALDLVTRTVDVPVTISNDVVLVDATLGDVRLTLPPVSTTTPKLYHFKKIDVSVNFMILDGNGLETIDGTLEKTTNTPYESFTLIPTPTGWFII